MYEIQRILINGEGEKFLKINNFVVVGRLRQRQLKLDGPRTQGEILDF